MPRGRRPRRKAEIPAAFKGAHGADLKPFPAKAPSIIDRVKLTWGGFLAEAVYFWSRALAWSMLTQNRVGITARQENIPLTIDPNYIVGFDFTRN
jgi:hypothetical protein